MLVACGMLLTACGSSSAQTAKSATPTSSPSATQPSEKPSPTPPTTAPTNSPTNAILTAKNSREFAAVLAAPDNCSDAIAGFAAKYEGRSIEFNGSISAMANHGSYKTRYDILVSPGDRGSSSTIGPTFQFQDVNVFDLNLTGKNIPASVGVDDKLHIVAQLDKYNSAQCLYFLTPVSTQVR